MSPTITITNCHYLSPITCTSTPINDQSTTQQPILPTKIILPNKKPQKWSTGVAPGDYGGPPTTTKLRKYWGGEKEDPLTSDDLIWNRDFMPHMKRIIGDDKDNVSDDPRLSTVKLSLIKKEKCLLWYRVSRAVPFFGGVTSGGGLGALIKQFNDGMGAVISEVKEKLPVGVEVQMSIVGLLKEKEDEIVNYVR
ncbi:hypothetical protein Tco_1330422 [Tanacetum coccineum]